MALYKFRIIIIIIVFGDGQWADAVSITIEVMQLLLPIAL